MGAGTGLALGKAGPHRHREALEDSVDVGKDVGCRNPLDLEADGLEGLQGLRVGGASVSMQHAGFLINDENGNASDYLALIAKVQQTVWEKTGVMLEPEVRIIGVDP